MKRSVCSRKLQISLLEAIKQVFGSSPLVGKEELRSLDYLSLKKATILSHAKRFTALTSGMLRVLI